MSQPVEVSEADRLAILEGSDGAGSAYSEYWRQEENDSDPEKRIKFLHDLVRSSGFAGNLSELLGAVKDASAFMQESGNNPALMRKSRPIYAKLLTDILRPRLAAQSLGGTDMSGHQGARLRAASLRLREFARTCDAFIDPARSWLAGNSGPQPVCNADLAIIAPFHILCAPNDLQPGDLVQTLDATIAATLRQAHGAKLRVAAIPDFAFGLLSHRPAQVLSFHTVGILPGFTHFKRGDLPGYMVLDRGGYSGWSSLSGADISALDLPSFGEAKGVYDQLRHDIVEANVSKYSQDDPSSQAEPLPENYVFVPMQVTGDRTQKVARFDMNEMLDIVVTRFRGTPITVVVKPHPKSMDLEQLARLLALAEQGDILLRFDSIHKLIAYSSAVVTVNSGVGSENLLHGKPLYCFGAADYDAVAHRIESAEQFNALTDPIRPAVSPEDLIRFCAYYRKTYLVQRDEPGRLDAAIYERVIAPILAER